MNKSFETKAGTSLIVFAILLVFTMVLHTIGGSVEHLIKITNVIVITHSIAILSLPFGWLGFWGLTRRIGTDQFVAMLAFAIISFGLVAAMLAGATNGLVLPIFLGHYKDSTPETVLAIKFILQYNSAVNHTFDYIYTGAFCLSILCWSILILSTKKLATWIGWLGIGLSLVTATIFVAGESVNTLHGLQILITGIVFWIVVVGTSLCKPIPKNHFK